MKYFTVKELTHSDTAKARNIDNTPSGEVRENLERLITNLLDPIREIWGKPLIVNSGYRCTQLNNAVGGVSNSNHLKGEAADITTGSKQGNLKLFEMVKASNLAFDELIDEKNGSWLHVALRKNNNRQKAIRL